MQFHTYIFHNLSTFQIPFCECITLVFIIFRRYLLLQTLLNNVYEGTNQRVN